VERILDLGVESIGQLVGKPSAGSLTDKGLNGRDERAVTREPDGIMRPEAGIIEASDFTKRIVAATMGVAGQVVEKFEFPKDGEVGGGAQGLLQLWQGSDFVAQEVFAKELGVKRDGPHNVIVPIKYSSQSEL
jgi:hypothetical protein